MTATITRPRRAVRRRPRINRPAAIQCPKCSGTMTSQGSNWTCQTCGYLVAL